MQGFEFKFPAVRGVQAGREFYVAMCPLAVIPKLFASDESSRRAHDRGQRLLNKGRVPKLARFLLENPGDYAFSAITACIDGAADFEPIGEDLRLGARAAQGARVCEPPHHRWSAPLASHLRSPPARASASPMRRCRLCCISMRALSAGSRSSRISTCMGLGRPGAWGSCMITAIPIAGMARTLADEVPLFAGRTEVEKTTISNRSANLFTLSAIYQATAALLGKREGDAVQEADFLVAFADSGRILGRGHP